MIRTTALAATIVLALLGTHPASAKSTVSILVNNLDLFFDGPNKVINRSSNGVTPHIDHVDSIVVEVDRQPILSLTSQPQDGLATVFTISQTSSTLIPDDYTTNVPGNGGLSVGTESDFFGLGATIYDISYLVVPSEIPGVNFFTLTAKGVINDQNLPNGIVLEQDIVISYTATDVVLNGPPIIVHDSILVDPADLADIRPDLGIDEVTDLIHTLNSSGQLNITGTLVPEPGSFALLTIGGFLAMKRRRRG